MKTKLVALALLSLIATGAHAAPDRTDAPASPSPAASVSPAKSTSATRHLLPFHGKISAADQAAKSFTIQGKEKSRVFFITADTQLTRGDAAATWDDLKIGAEVRGNAPKKGEAKYGVVSVNVQPTEDVTKSASPASPAASASPAEKK